MKRGRKPTGLPTRIPITTRLDEAMVVTLRARAQRAGVPFSVYIKQLLELAASKPAGG